MQQNRETNPFLKPIPKHPSHISASSVIKTRPITQVEDDNGIILREGSNLSDLFKNLPKVQVQHTISPREASQGDDLSPKRTRSGAKYNNQT